MVKCLIFGTVTLSRGAAAAAVTVVCSDLNINACQDFDRKGLKTHQPLVYDSMLVGVLKEYVYL